MVLTVSLLLSFLSGFLMHPRLFFWRCTAQSGTSQALPEKYCPQWSGHSHLRKREFILAYDSKELESLIVRAEQEVAGLVARSGS